MNLQDLVLNDEDVLVYDDPDDGRLHLSIDEDGLRVRQYDEETDDPIEDQTILLGDLDHIITILDYTLNTAAPLALEDSLEYYDEYDDGGDDDNDNRDGCLDAIPGWEMDRIGDTIRVILRDEEGVTRVSRRMPEELAREGLRILQFMREQI